MRKLWNELLNLFFPRLCLLCHRPLIDGEEQLCLHCSCNLSYTYFDDAETNEAAQLFMGKFPFEKATAMFYYQKGGAVQKLIHALKYHDNQEMAYYLGRQAAIRLKESGFMEDIDVLLPLPLHPSKKRKRGYNQAELIARGMASVFHLPIETTAVRRVVNTATQTHKQVYERWQNVQQVFALAGNTEHLQNKHILIVDDVITTGSTMSACATTCLSIPEVRVSMLGIALTHG
jgi:ComF family protein